MPAKNSHILVLTPVLLPILVGVSVLAALHSFGILFSDTAYPASGAFAVHCLLIAWTLRTALKRVNQSYSPTEGWAIFRNVMFHLTLYAMAILCFILGGIGLFQFGDWQMLYGLLIVPGMAVFATYSAITADDNDQAEEIDDDLRQEFEAEIAAEVSRPDAGDDLQTAGISALFQAGTVPLMFLTFGAGYMYYLYLNEAYFEGNVWPLERIPKIAFGYIEGVAPQMIGITIAIAVLFGSMGLWQAFVSWRRKNIQPDIDRDLSDTELNLIKECTARLESYVKALKTSIWLKSFSWLFLLVILVVVVGGILLVVTQEFGIGGEWYVADRTSGFEWFLYEDGLGAADFLLVLDATLAACFFWAWIARRSPGYQEYNVIEAKVQNRKDLDVLGDLRADIALDVRKRLITHLEDFDPSDYLQWKYRGYDKWINATFIGSLIITLPFWYLDRRDYVLFTPDYIEHVGYWNGDVTRTGYGDTISVGITCHLNDKDNIQLRYKLLLPEEIEVAVVDVSNRRDLKQQVPSVLQAWQTIDAYMRDANISRYYGRVRATAEVDPSRYTPNACMKEIANRLSYAEAEKVMRILEGKS